MLELRICSRFRKFLDLDRFREDRQVSRSSTADKTVRTEYLDSGPISLPEVEDVLGGSEHYLSSPRNEVIIPCLSLLFAKESVLKHPKLNVNRPVEAVDDDDEADRRAALEFRNLRKQRKIALGRQQSGRDRFISAHG